uniref:Uncharacterized protein n=1 Tax=Arundo donax TaxID=35708 RepID=A0A0A9ATN1_ARUDO
MVVPRRRVVVVGAVPRGGEEEVVVAAAVGARAGVGERGRRRRDLLVQLVLGRRAAQRRRVAAAAPRRRPRHAVHLAAGVHLHDLDVLLHLLVVPEAGVERRRRAPGRRRPWRPDGLVVLEQPEPRRAGPVLRGDERLHAAEGVAGLPPDEVAAHQRLQLDEPPQRTQRLPRQVGSEDGLDLDRGCLLDADDGGALGPRRGRREPGGGGGGLIGRHGCLGRSRGGDGHGHGVMVRVHPRLQEPVRETALRGRVLGRPGRRRRRAPEAPSPLLLGAERGRRRRGRPRQRQRLVRLRRAGLVLAPVPPARQEVSEPPTRLAHLQRRRRSSLDH